MKFKEFDTEFMGNQLKKLRKSSKLSQEKFAEYMGMSRDSISNYEHGKTAIPHDLVKQLCQQYNLSADYFYFDNGSVAGNLIAEIDPFAKEMGECSEFEKRQLWEILKVLRMKPIAV